MYFMALYRGNAPQAPLAVALATGFAVGSLKASKTACALFFFEAVQPGERGAERFQAEISSALGPLHPVEKGGDIHELVPRIEKIKIQALLPRHGREYKSNPPGGNGKQIGPPEQRNRRADNPDPKFSVVFCQQH